MDVREYLLSSEIKRYSHFDNKINITESLIEKIMDDNYIIHHSFYPFIKDDKVIFNYRKYLDHKPYKTRMICYSAHIDRLIYRRYAYQLNELYNKYAIEKGINKCAVAYRNNLHKNNIGFAKEVFDFIKKGNSKILVGDFSNFFDNLDHKYLKHCLKTILNVNTLSQDFYQVYKNITKFSFCELKNLLQYNKLKYTDAGIKKLNKQDTVMSIDEFNKFKALKDNNGLCNLQKNKNCGIPQGSSISAVLSNIFMIEFDVFINNLVEEYGGKYVRYCDDFIIIIPKSNESKFELIYTSLLEFLKKIKIECKEEKTKLYYTNQDKIYSSESNQECKLDYLGFSFDGTNVSLRDKTISRYYNKVYRKINTVIKANGVSSKGKRISCKNLYRLYSNKGAYYKESVKDGNFISYVNKCIKVFGESNSIKHIKQRHMFKIKKQLKKVKTELK